jgi:broad specificity phosphatase PhoE
VEKRKVNLYLVRHGETDWNVKGKIQGRQDIPLNANGIKQAKNMADLLRDTDIEYIYCSTLNRAFQTAEIIAKSKGLKVEQIEDLQEANFGDEEGNSKEQIITKYGKEFFEEFSYTANNMNAKYDNGETKKTIADRFCSALNRIVNTSKHNHIMIIAHGFVIRLFLLLNNISGVRHLDNCCICHCEYVDGVIKNIKIS